MLGNIKVTKTTFDDEQQQKEDYFMSLNPIKRLEIAEELRTRIWSDMYGKSYSYAGAQVMRK